MKQNKREIANTCSETKKTKKRIISRELIEEKRELIKTMAKLNDR